MSDRNVEEVLEALWACAERKEHTLEALSRVCHVPVDKELLSRLENEDLIAYDGEVVLLTGKGRELAALIARRHRLAERLLVDVLGMSLHDAEKGACEFEHVVAPEVADSICTLLGHPRHCPHGAPIPHGKCCVTSKEVVDNVIVPLTRLKAGAAARIAYISTSVHSRLHKLMSFGIGPGMSLTVHQKYPSYVISCEHTELALEEEVARDIYVWRDSHEGPQPDHDRVLAGGNASR